MKSHAYLLICLCVLFSPAPAYTAENETEADEQSFIALPVLLYTSDTGAGFGAAGVKTYRRHLPRTSNLRFNAIYTTKKQFISSAVVEHYFREGKDRFLASMEYRKFPTDFFGIGNDTDNDDPERYTPESFKFQAFWERQVYGNLKVRPALYIYHAAVIDRESGGVFEAHSIPWARGRFDIGPGLGIVWDTRDNTQSTVSGRFIALDGYRFIHQNEGDGFTLLSLDIRSFINPVGDIVLASMIEFRTTQGDVPYYFFSQLGGDEDLRGYEDNRFIDKSLFLVQQDIRFPIWWRLGGAVFVAAGQVAPRLSKVFEGTFHVAYGIGGRFYINREDHLQVRADLAFSEDSDGFYISFGEAF